MSDLIYDVAIIGAGPAGLAAAAKAASLGADVVLIERETRTGGILKQCIHDGFGVIRFKEKLSGPEYAERFIDEVKEYISAGKIKLFTETFVTKIIKESGTFCIDTVNRNGISKTEAKTVILATGCRERTARQISIHGSRPSGIFTAGTAQYLINTDGITVGKNCVILGSGDIGLIMARRLTLEGARVLGVYEAKASPSGLSRNIQQCLTDYNIPLHLSHTVTNVFGRARVEAVETAEVDSGMRPIEGTQKRIECDTLILSVGLIPENEVAEKLGVQICPYTKGAVVDEGMMTNIGGVFSCGNALHVNDLVDYVSENAETAALSAVEYSKSGGKKIGAAQIEFNSEILYTVPQRLNIDAKSVTLYFRAKRDIEKSVLKITQGKRELFTKKYNHTLRPSEMERVVLNFDKADLNEDEICVELSEVKND